jgi:hypothetical protein
MALHDELALNGGPGFPPDQVEVNGEHKGMESILGRLLRENLTAEDPRQLLV